MLLDIETTKEILKTYKIPFLETKAVFSVKEARGAASENGFPVVLKADNEIHRTEKGLIIKDIFSEADLQNAFLTLKKKTKNNILIQKQAQGIELFFGLKTDPTFGKVLSFGLGGVFVEALQDVIFGIATLSKSEALLMIKSIKGRKILDGFRGMPKINIAKLADILAALDTLSRNITEIKEIDLNPVMAWGSMLQAIDFKIVVE